LQANKKANLLLILSVVALLVALGLAVFFGWKAWEVYRVRNTVVEIWEAPEGMQIATEKHMATATEKRRPMELVLSPSMKVTVNGTETPVYETNVSLDHLESGALPNQSRTPVVYFDFKGQVTVEVEVSEMELTTAKIMPTSAGIVPTVYGNTVSFTLTEPGDYTLEFNDSFKRAMHIFTNLPDPDAEKYAAGGENIIYYGPGEYKTDSIKLESGQTLYVAGGAVIHGSILVDHAENVKILGRGIIDGSLYGGDANDRAVRIPINISESNNVEVEGLMLLSPNAWVLQGYIATDVTVDRVKIISSRANGDGITLQSCVNFHVEDCFVRSWDDSLVVKNYQRSSDNITFERVQIWTDIAQSMEVGYETNKGNIENATITNVLFKDITVLYNFHKPVMSIHNSDNAHISGVTFENITVEHADMSYGDALIEIQVNQSGWSTTLERGSIDGVHIKNVDVLDTTHQRLSAVVEGYGNDHFVENVIFEDITIKGEKVDSFMGALEFITSDRNTSGIYLRTGE